MEDMEAENCSAESTDSLIRIHQIFDGVYGLAGQIRTMSISKGSFRFAPARFLDQTLSEIEKMPQSNFDQILKKYVDMNVAHPLLDGNGLATRIRQNDIVKVELHQMIDWTRIPKDDYLLAMEASLFDDSKLKVLLKQALTDEIYDKYLLFSGWMPAGILRNIIIIE